MEGTNQLEGTESSLCRLCGVITENGTYLFSKEQNPNLCCLINRYLPLKVEDDGKYPDKICPGCEIQLQATKLFFDLIIQGQSQLKLMYEHRQELQLSQVENHHNISSNLNTIEIQSSETGAKYFIQILDHNDGQSLYCADHEMVNYMNNLTKEKKRRGRPKKQITDKDKTDLVDISKEKEESSIETVNKSEKPLPDDGKRQRKIPARFSETVQGKELDDILKKEGIEEDFDSYKDNVVITEEKLIGRVESQNGEELDEPVIVTKVFNSNRSRRKGIQNKKRRRKYTCEECFAEFRNFARLKIHICKTHEIQDEEHKLEQNVLTECTETAPDLVNEANSHESHGNSAINQSESLPNSETCQETLSCDQCDKVFSCKQNLNTHIEAVHEKKKPFSCPECKQNFPYAKTLKIHQLKHKKALYVCEVCQKKFNHPSSLIYHRNAEHNGKRFICNKCNKTFKHRQLLHRHQLVHTEDRPYKCEFCTSAFKTKTNLLSHKSVHTGEKNFTCNECGQSFSYKTSLNLHMRWHLGEKPFTCEICTKSFSQKGNLLEHQRIHTGEKPFCCEHCGRNFTTSSQLKLHRKRHTGERPWKCEFCSKTFLHKDSWKEHSRRHLNDRPFKCHLCPKSFTTTYCLKKHLRFHTGEKPHSCDICLKGFADPSNLTKHRRIHEQKSLDENHTPVPVLDTDVDNLFYVYYETPKEQNEEDPIAALEEVQAEEIVQSDQQSVNYKEDCLQFQLIDQEGNPLSLNTREGEQINVVSSITNDGEQKLQGLLPDGTLVAIDLRHSKVNTMERLVDQVEEENSVSHLLLDGNMTFLTQNINKPENEPAVCFVTYDPQTEEMLE